MGLVGRSVGRDLKRLNEGLKRPLFQEKNQSVKELSKERSRFKMIVSSSSIRQATLSLCLSLIQFPHRLISYQDKLIGETLSVQHFSFNHQFQKQGFYQIALPITYLVPQSPLLFAGWKANVSCSLSSLSLPLLSFNRSHNRTNERTKEGL